MGCKRHKVNFSYTFTDNLRGIEVPDAGVRPLLDAVGILDEDVQGETKHEPRVTIPSSGTEIYKSTLVSLLNQDPQLSHERSVPFIWMNILFSFNSVIQALHSTITSNSSH